MRRVICGLLCVVAIGVVGLNIVSGRQHLNVVEKVDYSFKDGDYQIDTYKAYDEFIEINKRYCKEISEEELESKIKQAQIHRERNRQKLISSEVKKIILKQISEEEFEDRIEQVLVRKERNRAKSISLEVRKIILDGLYIEFLVSGIDKRKLVVTTIEEKEYKSYRERRLIFEDPFVGEFEVLVLIPMRRVERYPAIIGLHGHEESAAIFRDIYLGVELVQAGFIV